MVKVCVNALLIIVQASSICVCVCVYVRARDRQTDSIKSSWQLFQFEGVDFANSGQVSVQVRIHRPEETRRDGRAPKETIRDGSAPEETKGESSVAQFRSLIFLQLQNVVHVSIHNSLLAISYTYLNRHLPCHLLKQVKAVIAQKATRSLENRASIGGSLQPSTRQIR